MKPAKISFRSIPEASGKFFVEATTSDAHGESHRGLTGRIHLSGQDIGYRVTPFLPGLQPIGWRPVPISSWRSRSRPRYSRLRPPSSLPLWKASETDWINARSFSVRLKSPSIFRSWNSRATAYRNEGDIRLFRLMQRPALRHPVRTPGYEGG